MGRAAAHIQTGVTSPLLREMRRAGDQFDSLLGRGRGSHGVDGALDVPGAAGAARAQALISLVVAGALNEPLAALASLGPVPGADEAERAYEWPPPVSESNQPRSRWNSSAPDAAAVLAADPAGAVRRAVAESVSATAIGAWLPVLRDFSHVIGLRRRDIADHVVSIDGVLHFFEPANVMLAGMRGYTQTMVCGASAYEPVREGRLQYVPRGVYAATRAVPTLARSTALCAGCSWPTGRGYEEAQSESAQDYLPAPKFEWVQDGTTARTHQHLQRHPNCGEAALRDISANSVREIFLDLVCEPMQRDDKPCLWYRAPGLSKEERGEVGRLTYDARIFGDPVTAMLNAQLPVRPGGFTADENWSRAWCEQLLAHLRGRVRPAGPW